MTTTVRKRQPKYGWHGQITTTVMDGCTVGDRVCHKDEPKLHGTILSGPHKRTSFNDTYHVWTIQWDGNWGVADHTTETIRKV